MVYDHDHNLKMVMVNGPVGTNLLRAGLQLRLSRLFRTRIELGDLSDRSQILDIGIVGSFVRPLHTSHFGNQSTLEF